MELTTLRPKLVTKKNRKIRRMNELYPEINVQLWKRSDLRNLMLRFGMDEHVANIMGTEAQNNGNELDLIPLKHTAFWLRASARYYSAQKTLRTRVLEMGQEISRDYERQPPAADRRIEGCISLYGRS